MDPIAIVTVILAVLYIGGRGSLVAAPVATVAVYRRLLSSPGRIRIFGSLLLLLGVAVVVTARQAPAESRDITILIEGLGWLAAASAVWVLAAPDSFRRLKLSFWDALSNPARRAIGAANIAFGFTLGWVAFFAL